MTTKTDEHGLTERQVEMLSDAVVWAAREGMPPAELTKLRKALVTQMKAINAAAHVPGFPR